jgi:hypothetical protein
MLLYQFQVSEMAVEKHNLLRNFICLERTVFAVSKPYEHNRLPWSTFKGVRKMAKSDYYESIYKLGEMKGIEVWRKSSKSAVK